MAVSVPVIRLIRRLATNGMSRELVADEVVVAAFQEQGARRPNVTIALTEDTQTLDLREESAGRLLDALSTVLGLIDN